MTIENQEVEGDGVDERQEAFEKEAKEMGWVSKEEFQGDEEKWVDAKTYIERGENIIPIMRANNKRMRQDLLTRDKEIATLKSSVENANKAIKALQKSYTESTKQQVEQAKKELREQLKQAREVGDVDAEFTIQDKLDDLKQAGKEEKEQQTPKEDEGQSLNPEFISWNKDNPWFGDMTDTENRKRTRTLVRIGEDLRDEGDQTTGRAFMDKCMDILEKQEGKGTQRVVAKGASKVEGSAPGTRSTNGRAFDSLPKEAKDACHEDNESFVGPGKMFKTVKEWEDHFANLYGEG